MKARPYLDYGARWVMGLCIACLTASPGLARDDATFPAEDDGIDLAVAFGAMPAPVTATAPRRSPISTGRALDIEGTQVRLGKSSGLPGPVGNWTSTYAGPFATPAGSPLRYTAISSRYGMRWHPVLGAPRFHAGLDMAAPTGVPVVATAPGKVMAAGWCGGYGYCITIDHGRGYSTLFGHLSAILVTPGQVLPAGQAIGRVGSTGRSTGPHLHYEIRKGGQPIDPATHF